LLFASKIKLTFCKWPWIGANDRIAPVFFETKINAVTVFLFADSGKNAALGAAGGIPDTAARSLQKAALACHHWALRRRHAGRCSIT
jgi:hypothetical protein